MSKDIGNNLIVNYVPQFMTDDEFKSMFISLGPIKTSKVVRDKATGFSYGFGFVEYETESDADRAVKVFDGLHMQGKRIRVQHANKQDELNKGHNLYVKNIPSSYTETELDRLFEPYGKIVTSKVLMDLQTGQSRNVGFVLYDTKAEADKAISALHSTTPIGFTSSMIVKFADDSTKKMTKMTTPTVPQVTSPVQQFKQPFAPSPVQGNGFNAPSPTGPIRNQNTNRFNRFNPIGRDNTNNFNNTGNFNNTANFNNSAYNNAATNNSFAGNYQNYSGGYAGGMNTGGMNSGGMNSGMSSPALDIPQGPGPYSIFVLHIGEDAEERELWALFSPFGIVQKCTVMMDTEKKICKGYGFVDMTNAREAASAIDALNGFVYKGRQLNVSFKSKKKQ